jgi:hypothetical protein
MGENLEWIRCVNDALAGGGPFRAEAVLDSIDAFPRVIFGRVPNGGLVLWSETMFSASVCTTSVFAETCTAVRVQANSRYKEPVLCTSTGRRKVCSEKEESKGSPTGRDGP